MARTIGELNYAWTQFTKDFASSSGGSYSAQSIVNARFCQLAREFKTHYWFGLNRIDAYRQTELLPVPVDDAFVQWHQAVKEATGRDYLL